MAIALARLGAVAAFCSRLLRAHGVATKDARIAFELANPREGRTIEPTQRRSGWTMSEINLPLEPSGVSLAESLLESFGAEFAAAGSAEALVEQAATAFPSILNVQKSERIMSDGSIRPTFRVALGARKPTPTASK